MKRWTRVASFCACLFAPLAAQADEVQIQHDGLALKADFDLAQGKTVQDGVVILVHGTLAHHRMEIVETTSELLRDAGYSTLAIISAMAWTRVVPKCSIVALSIDTSIRMRFVK